ncbi:MAG: TlpA family protein disulfide reductase [Bdellovibrionales bacterium]
MKHLLKGFLAVAVLGGALWLGWLRYHDFLTAGMQPTLGTQKLNEMEVGGVPDFELEDLNGNRVKLSQFADRTVILSFWASWCDPCVAEFPSMVKLVEHFKGQVVLLAVSADKSKADIESFLKPYANKLPKDCVIVWDKERKVAEQYGTEALPESYILSKGLKIVRKVAGSEDWYSPGAVQLFEAIVKLEPGQDPKQLFSPQGAGLQKSDAGSD